MNLTKKQEAILRYVDNRKAYIEYLSARSNHQTVYLLELNKAIDSEGNTLILKKDSTKNKIVINYSEFLRLNEKEKKINEYLLKWQEQLKMEGGNTKSILQDIQFLLKEERKNEKD